MLAQISAKAQDTVSTAGIEFTPATPIALIKPAAVKVEKSAVTTPAKPGKKEQSTKTLWAIFLAGLACHH